MEAEAEEEAEETEEEEDEELSRRAGRHLLLQRAVRAWQRRPPAPPRSPRPTRTGDDRLPSQADEAVELLQVRG